jgi:hypothetical protein
MDHLGTVPGSKMSIFEIAPVAVFENVLKILAQSFISVILKIFTSTILKFTNGKWLIWQISFIYSNVSIVVI